MSGLGQIVGSNRRVLCIMYYVQCIHGCSNERGEDKDRKEGSELPGGWERVEIAWPLVCR